MSYSESLANILAEGGIAIMKTDTIYGIVGRADDEAAVERIYSAKQRTPSKSPIILIANTSQLFDSYDQAVLTDLEDFWPGPNSIILPSSTAPQWIRRDNASVAYRMPANDSLRQLLQKTGPLIAPSANPEGLPPAQTIDQARAYFHDLVDFYEDGGAVTTNTPSALYAYDFGTFTKLR